MSIDIMNFKQLLEQEFKSLDEQYNDLPLQVVEAFNDLAKAQRGRPEQQMLTIQHNCPVATYNKWVEDIGDLTNRMAKDVTYTQAGFGAIKEKLEKRQIEKLFEPNIYRELMDRFESNFNFLYEEGEIGDVSFEDWFKNIKRMSVRYAQYHDNLKVYNEAQYHARKAAVNIGMWNINGARYNIRTLKRVLDQGPEAWYQWATEYELDESGRLVPYMV